MGIEEARWIYMLVGFAPGFVIGGIVAVAIMCLMRISAACDFECRCDEEREKSCREVNGRD